MGGRPLTCGMSTLGSPLNEPSGKYDAKRAEYYDESIPRIHELPAQTHPLGLAEPPGCTTNSSRAIRGFQLRAIAGLGGAGLLLGSMLIVSEITPPDTIPLFIGLLSGLQTMSARGGAFGIRAGKLLASPYFYLSPFMSLATLPLNGPVVALGLLLGRQKYISYIRACPGHRCDKAITIMCF